MINVSTYWTLPPSDQGVIRDEIEKYEDMHNTVGYYNIFKKDENNVHFYVLCSICYDHELDGLIEPITKEEYMDQKHFMHNVRCGQCNELLA